MTSCFHCKLVTTFWDGYHHYSSKRNRGSGRWGHQLKSESSASNKEVGHNSILHWCGLKTLALPMTSIYLAMRKWPRPESEYSGGRCCHTPRKKLREPITTQVNWERPYWTKSILLTLTMQKMLNAGDWEKVIRRRKTCQWLELLMRCLPCLRVSNFPEGYLMWKE